VYVAEPSAGAGLDAAVSERMKWLGTVLAGAWLRRIPLTELATRVASLFEQPVRCACIESAADHMEAFCVELAEDFGLATESITLEPPGGSAARDEALLRKELPRFDMAVTTAFHAARVRPVATELGIPSVIVAVNPRLASTINRKLHGDSPLRVIVADARYAQRAEEYLSALAQGSRYEILLADDPKARRAVEAGEEVLLTRAARRRLGIAGPHLEAEIAPFIAAPAAEEVINAMITIAFRRRSRR
jgi:hypothetical protein